MPPLGIEALPDADRPMTAEVMATNEQGQRLPLRGSLPFEELDLPTYEATLDHCVIDVLVEGSCDFLGFVGVVGFYFFDVAVAVEGDYFYRVVFELAVGKERAVEYV